MADEMSDRFDKLEQMLAAVFGAQAASHMVEKMRQQGIDPARLPLPDTEIDPAMAAQMMSQMQSFFSSGGPVNWTVARELARTRAREGDHRVLASRGDDLRRALMQADLWLDTVTDLSCAAPRRTVWNREGWVEGTFGVWQQLCEPVADNATRAIVSALEDHLGHEGMEDATMSAAIPGVGPLLGPMAPGPMIEQLGSGLFGMQLGQAIGGLAHDALGSSDIGIPLGGSHEVALVDVNVATFASELDMPADTVEAFLAVREAAHARLFGAAPWLRAHAIDAVRRLACEIRLDVEAIDAALREAMESGDQAGGMNPDTIAASLSQSLFSPEPTPAQREALTELETTLAVIEGWVAEVTIRACRPFLPQTLALAEMMRRRRASGSPAEQVLHSFIGLQLRPKRARDAQALWAHITDEVGQTERDALWSHPAAMPTAADLDDPATFFARREAEQAEQADVDRELADLLGGRLGYATGLEPGVESAGDESVTKGEE